jgi:hypothetical protein
MEISTDLEDFCPRCGLPREQWSDNGAGYARADRRYCCRGCAEATGCTCLEAGPAA